MTEEVWSWWQEGSIHRTAWPTATELGSTGQPEVFAAAAEVLGAIRKAKSEANVSMRTAVSRVTVVDVEEGGARSSPPVTT